MEKQQQKKKKKITIVFRVLVLVFFCARCFAIEDGIGNPTVPPSSVRSGLVKSPNPVGNSGNLTVTGNVSGMTYFHGDVPYRSTTEFGAPLGTSDISSFLRRTAPIGSSTRPQFLPQPYYLPSSTVSTLAPNALGTALTYPSIRTNKGTGEFVTPRIPKVEKEPEISAASPLYDYSRTRPLSYEPTDLGRSISYDLIREKNKKDLSNALQRASRNMHEITIEDKQAKQPTGNTLQIPQPVEPAKRFELLEPLQPGQVVSKGKVEKPAGSKDVYEQMLEETAKTLQPKDVSHLPKGQPSEQKQKQAMEREQDQNKKPEEKGPSDLRSELGEIEKQTAEAVVSIHKSFATQAKDKFNYYMRTAEEFLKRGKYYSAVDAYTLATIYKSDDPLAYAGRSHALFASGEYISSAYFLTRAISIFPQYVNFKIDLNAMIPDANRLENRIEDVKTWTERTESAELSFLLAYIYYQLDQTDLALEAIKISAEKIPDSAAIKALKQAIEKKSR